MTKPLFIILAGLLVSACARETPLSEACSTANDGKDVTTSGYLDDSSERGMLCSNPGMGRMSCQYAVLAEPGSKEIFTAFIDQGNDKNQGEKPAAGYKRDDIKVRDDKRLVISLSDKVRLTGKMTVFGRGCTMAVDKIER